MKLEYRRTWKLALCACVSMLAAFILGTQTSEALSNYGPDPHDFNYGSYGFMVTTHNSPNVVIPTTDVEIYFRDKATQTISIVDGDMCVPGPGDYRNTGGDNRDIAFYGGWKNGNRVTQYRVVSGSYKTGIVYGRFNNSGNCRFQSLQITVDVSKLYYDSSIGYYVGTLVAETMPRGTPGGDSGSQNLFEVQMPRRDDIVGLDASLPETSFGMSRQSPPRSYSDWNLWYGTPCDQSSVRATGYTYDDDNGDSAVQPAAMYNEVRQYKPNGRGGYDYVGNAPLTWYWENSSNHWVKLTGSGFPYVKRGPDANSYYVYSGSERHIKMEYTAHRGYRYDWYWHGVYYVNVMDFRLPFNSIYAAATCRIPPPTCGSGFSLTPGVVDPATSFTGYLPFDFSSYDDALAAQQAGDRISVKVAGPAPGDPFTYGPVSLRPPPPNSGSSTLAATTTSIGPTGRVGQFGLTYDLTDSSGNVITTCPHNFTIAYMPYFNVVGGDVKTGAGMTIDDLCVSGGTPVACGGSSDVPPDNQGGVVSWNQGGSGFGGAGTQYAAYALGQIQDFATAQIHQLNPLYPTGLGFANTKTDVSAGIFGGELGSESPIRDYFEGHPVSPTQPPGTITQVSSGTHVIYVQGDETIDLAGGFPNIPNHSHTTIYVSGSVTIESNITYSQQYSATKSYGAIAAIPSFTVVAKGDIYVRPNVTELDGVYAAEPIVNPITRGVSQGIIYTCTTLPSIPIPHDPHLGYDTSTYYGDCNNHLDVYGAVTARQIWLLRTYGTLYRQPLVPAETFHYTPEVWLSLDQPNYDSYDAITSLPPVL